MHDIEPINDDENAQPFGSAWKVGIFPEFSRTFRRDAGVPLGFATASDIPFSGSQLLSFRIIRLHPATGIRAAKMVCSCNGLPVKENAENCLRGAYTIRHINM